MSEKKEEIKEETKEIVNAELLEAAENNEIEKPEIETAAEANKPEESETEVAAEVSESEKPEQTSVEEKKGRIKRRRILAFSSIGILLVLYLALTVYYRDHLFWNTVINGTNYANYIPASADLTLRNESDDYCITIIGRNGDSAVISANEISFYHVYAVSTEEIKSQQNALLWIGALFGESSYSLEHTVSYNEIQLQEVLGAIPFLQENNMTVPRDAYIGPYNESLKSFEIIPEDEGTLLDTEKVYMAVCEAIRNQQPEIILENCGCYIQPDILQDNAALLDELNYYNKYLTSSVTYQFGQEKVVVDFNVYRDWIIEQNRGGGFTIDETAVKEFLTALAKEYDTYNQRMNFTTIDGYVLNLPRGDFGWKMDVEAEKELLINDIQTGNIDTREPVYSCEGATRENDIGDFYIEVNLTAQMVYIVDDGEVVLESSCVTGNMSNGNATPPGIFGLTYKERNATLRGTGYVSHVKYWMPFNGNVGLHDASWRNTFGGNIYLTNGSHGCINLPTAFAAQLYDYMYDDCPVICYYLTDDVIVERPVQEEDEAAEEGDLEADSRESGSTASGNEATGNSGTGSTGSNNGETGAAGTGSTETVTSESGNTEIGNTETGNTESPAAENPETENPNPETGAPEAGNTPPETIGTEGTETDENTL